MGKGTAITQQFQHLVWDLKESFWGDLYGKTPRAWERFWEEESRQARDRYLVRESYERADGSQQLLGFLRSRGESRAGWEGLLMDLYRRGLEGHNLKLITTDGCEGLAAALQTVHPQVLHQRCWAHKMRNLLEKVRKRDYDRVKADAQAI